MGWTRCREVELRGEAHAEKNDASDAVGGVQFLVLRGMSSPSLAASRVLRFHLPSLRVMDEEFGSVEGLVKFCQEWRQNCWFPDEEKGMGPVLVVGTENERREVEKMGREGCLRVVVEGKGR